MHVDMWAARLVHGVIAGLKEGGVVFSIHVVISKQSRAYICNVWFIWLLKYTIQDLNARGIQEKHNSVLDSSYGTQDYPA